MYRYYQDIAIVRGDPLTQMYHGIGTRPLQPPTDQLKGFLVVTNLKILHSDLIVYVGNLSVYSFVCRSMLELASA